MTEKCDNLVKESQGVSNTKGKITSLDKQINIDVYKTPQFKDLSLNTNLQEKLLDEANSNLIEIGKNITETAKSIKEQGGSIKNMNEMVDNTGQNIKIANLKLNSLTWGQRTQLLFMHSIAVMLFIAIAIIVFIKLFKY